MQSTWPNVCAAKGRESGSTRVESYIVVVGSTKVWITVFGHNTKLYERLNSIGFFLPISIFKIVWPPDFHQWWPRYIIFFSTSNNQARYHWSRFCQNPFERSLYCNRVVRKVVQNGVRTFKMRFRLLRSFGQKMRQPHFGFKIKKHLGRCFPILNPILAISKAESADLDIGDWADEASRGAVSCTDTYQRKLVLGIRERIVRREHGKTPGDEQPRIEFD